MTDVDPPPTAASSREHAELREEALLGVAWPAARVELERKAHTDRGAVPKPRGFVALRPAQLARRADDPEERALSAHTLE